MSRKIEDLVPEMQAKAREFAGRMAEIGVPWMLTSTYRSQADQDALWRIGRSEPGQRVTWTKISRHTGRTAFDIAILKDGKPCWDVKASVNEDDTPDYLEAGQIGESIGLIWGGRFKRQDGAPIPDYPHFELKGV
jgi:peptidoglycan L-alanyl-D-glutamate endopeptidase CwlK